MRRGSVPFLLALVLLIVPGCQTERRLAPESTRQLRVVGVRRLIDRPALSPAVWSPDSTRIAYTTERDVRVVSTDGTDRRIAAADVATAISWSVPLNRLALIDRGAVWTMRDDGSGRTRIPLNGFAAELAWAPGSDRLAVIVRRLVEGQGSSELWLVSADGGFRRRVLAAPVSAGRAMRDLQWFPDSLFLLYGLSLPTDRVIEEAWQVRIAYPNRWRIPVHTPAQMLRLSPSGRWLAYLSGPEIADGRGQVTVSRPDGTGRRALTPPGRYAGLAWSPQGDKLAFAELTDEAHAEIWIADADGSGRLHVFSYPLEFSDPSIGLSMSWAPSSRALLFGTNTGSFLGPIWLAELGRR